MNAYQLQAYRAAGFHRARGVLDVADVEAMREEWKRLWAEVDPAHPHVQLRGHGVDGQRADRIDPAYPLSPRLDALAGDPRVSGLAAVLLGSPVVRFKDKLISKAPGTHGYGLHQDWPYWSDHGIPADRMVTLMIALDPCDAANGALEVFPTERGVLPPPADDDARDADPGSVDLSRGTIVALDPGDVLALHPLAPHRSAPNLSQANRRTYFITYVSDAFAAAARRYEAHRLGALA